MDQRYVLIAEDDPCIRRIAQVALARAGFVVTVVEDGLEALAAMKDQVPDAAVLDGMMPRMDGLDVCRTMRTDARLSHVPVILMSARTQAADEAAGRLAGVGAYIRKPFDAMELINAVRAACRMPAAP
jgi:DNA-binding response OmpR family regulator